MEGSVSQSTGPGAQKTVFWEPLQGTKTWVHSWNILPALCLLLFPFGIGILVLWNSAMSLLIFCLLGLLTTDGRKGVAVSNCNSGVVYFSRQLLPYVFWLALIRHIYSKDCYAFLKRWPPYPYVMPLSIHDNFPYSIVWNSQVLALYEAFNWSKQLS